MRAVGMGILPVVKRNFKILLAPVVFLLLGLSWTIASPPGSSADEQFHATSIWCAWGESETCEIAPDQASVNVPGAISKSFCYVSWPAILGAGCLSEFIENSPYNDTLTTATYFSLDSYYSPAYFKVARTFVGLDVEDSVLSIRLFNVVLASLFFLWALAVSTPPIKRALALSWGLAIIPVGIFFIASINPSSWMILSVGTYWAFLATALSPRISSKRRSAAWIGALATSLVALGSRTDAVLYLSIATAAILVLQWRAIAQHLNRAAIFILVALSTLIGLLGVRIFTNRFSTLNLGWGSDIAADGLPVPLKTISEMPVFFFGLFGGQGFFSDIRTARENFPDIRISGFLYGLGWMEFDLPAFVGLFGATSALVVIFLMLRNLSVSKALAVFLLIFSSASVILVLRATVDFRNSSQVQPRYFFPLLIAGLGIVLVARIKKKPLLSNAQGWFLVIVLTVSGSVAWLATATRYAVGPYATLTDFGQPYEWWWHIGPGRLGWFIFTIAVTGLWLFATVFLWGRVSRRALESPAKTPIGAQLDD